MKLNNTLSSLSTLGKLVFLLILSINSARADQKNKLGFILPLSGPFAEAGEQCRLGIETAFGLAAAPNLSPIYGDNQFKVSSSLIEFRKMVEIEKVAALMSFGSTVTLPLADPNRRAKLPMVVISGHPQILDNNEYALRSFPAADQQASKFAEILTSEDTLAIITTEDEWLLSLAKHMKEVANKKAILLLENITIDSEQSDFRALLPKLTAAKVIHVNIFPGQMVTLIKQLRSINYTGTILTNYYVQQTDIIAALGEKNLDGVIFTEGDLNRPNFQKFYQSISSELGANITTYSCYAGTVLFIAAYQASNNQSDLNKLKADVFNFIKKSSSIKLADEELTIRNREVILPVKLYQFRSGRITTLK